MVLKGRGDGPGAKGIEPKPGSACRSTTCQIILMIIYITWFTYGGKSVGKSPEYAGLGYDFT